MVRPRGAGFCYSDEDFSVMCEDARRFSRMGADGVVFGFLTADGPSRLRAVRALPRMYRRL